MKTIVIELKRHIHRYALVVVGLLVLLSVVAPSFLYGAASEGYIITMHQDTIASDSGSIPLQEDAIAADTAARSGSFEDIITGSGKDSMTYNLKSGILNIYNEGDVKYVNTQLKADFFEMKLFEDLIIAKGVQDTVTGQLKKARFIENQTTYDLDSMVYNIKSKKAKIYQVAFQEGEGILYGENIKMVGTNTFNIEHGRYTTCNNPEPHFCFHLSKALFVDTDKGRKVVFGPMSFEFEGVKLPAFIPFGFFPMVNDTNSGIILPEVGEENLKGFYVRDMGYYHVFNDYVDLTTTAGFYTYGSWEAAAKSAYKVRYKYSGNASFNFSNDVYATSDSPDYYNMNNYKFTWTHSQDPKFMPGTTFSASVNWSSTNYNKYDATDMDDYVSSQTNSTISFSKSWTGMSLSTNIQHSQNNSDSTVMLSMPNVSFNVSRFMPLQRKSVVGSLRWYEKIGMSYTGNFTNTVTTKSDELFTADMFENLKYGFQHSVPISTSLTLLKYLNISPSVNYTERWYFNSIEKEWDPYTSSVVTTDTIPGFARVYNYNFSTSFSTAMYGMYAFKGKDPLIKAVRHVITPTVSASYAPNFGDAKYGYYKAVQSSTQGDVSYYSPYENGVYGVPGRGETGSLSFSLNQNLEMKVRNRADTTGFKKLKLIESLNISSSYNFLADSMNLSNFSVSFRTTLIKSVGLNISSTFDPYALDDDGKRINVYNYEKTGKLARLTSLGFSFGYSFRSAFGLEGGTGSASIPQSTNIQQNLTNNSSDFDYAKQQYMLSQSYYDFSVPWNLSVNYVFSYSKSGLVPNLTQTMSFNGGISLTSKFAFTMSAGYDFESGSLTPGTISMTRDLHCFQMSFSWVPVGFRKSWNFTIRATSSLLQDLKYEKDSGYTSSY